MPAAAHAKQQHKQNGNDPAARSADGFSPSAPPLHGDLDHIYIRDMYIYIVHWTASHVSSFAAALVCANGCQIRRRVFDRTKADGKDTRKSTDCSQYRKSAQIRRIAKIKPEPKNVTFDCLF
jgi:hypothetical protein